MITKFYGEGKANYLMMYKNIPIYISESTVQKAVCIKPLDGVNSPVSGILLNCRSYFLIFNTVSVTI